MYTVLVAALALSGFVGSSMASWIRNEQGGLGTFLRTQFFEIVFGGVVLLFAVDGLSRWISAVARRKEEESARDDL
jgi:hypothetical protein